MFQIKSTFTADPATIHTATRIAYTFTAFDPNKYLIFASPKKYHPMIVENAKKNIQIAMKTSTKFSKYA